MHYEILDEKRKSLLPIFSKLKAKFYLAGGTALAFQIGHRDSIDFDFFTELAIDTEKLFEELRDYFVEHTIIKNQEEKNTLGIVIDETIKCSFMKYNYPLIGEVIEDNFFRLASISDIACMKLATIVSRATLKDYVDIYEILKLYSLEQVLEWQKQKLPSQDTALVLKSLVYFDDIDLTPIEFMPEKKVSFEEIKFFLIEVVKKHQI